MEKDILDMTCGSRTMWYNKERPDVLYTDIRKEEHELNGRTCIINPDIIANFTNLPFETNTFEMVIFDPPHIKNIGPTAWLAKKYGMLFEGWELDIKEGFKEAMRVLKPKGFLIFKWAETDIKIEQILNIIETEPMFGQRTNKNKSTIWMIFRK